MGSGNLEEVVLLEHEVKEGRMLIGEPTSPPPPPLMRPRAFKDAETQEIGTAIRIGLGRA